MGDNIMRLWNYGKEPLKTPNLLNSPKRKQPRAWGTFFCRKERKGRRGFGQVGRSHDSAVCAIHADAFY